MSLLSATGRSRTVLVLCTVAVVSFPASGFAQSTKPFAALSNSATNLRDSVVQMARAQIGRRYRTGGVSPEKGFDCSGLIQYVMTALSVKLPRTAKQQALQGAAIAKDTNWLMPGDLLTFGKGKKGEVSHIGIYVGNGHYVHASSVAGKVIESAIDRPFSPLIKVWRGARRVLAPDDSNRAVLAVIEAPPAVTKQKN
jgi:cell wall-associated NlpC family hydrolase